MVQFGLENIGWHKKEKEIKKTLDKFHLRILPESSPVAMNT